MTVYKGEVKKQDDVLTERTLYCRATCLADAAQQMQKWCDTQPEKMCLSGCAPAWNNQLPVILP